MVMTARSRRSLSGGAYMEDLQELNVRIARAVARQMRGTIKCPACMARGVDQALLCDGDAREVMFCPICKLEIYISVNGWPHHYGTVPMDEWRRRINCEGEVSRPKEEVIGRSRTNS